MKNKKLLMIAIAVFVFSFIYKYSITENIPFAASYEVQADVTVSKENTIYCQRDGADKNAALLVEQELMLIPETVRELFIENGWHIYVTDENLADVYFKGEYSKVYGCTFYEKKLILMSDDETAITTATIHEMGHFFDYINGSLSNTKEFYALYEKECSNFEVAFDRDCKVLDTKEYFAECFYHYVKNPHILKEAAPETYSFIHYYVTR